MYLSGWVELSCLCLSDRMMMGRCCDPRWAGPDRGELLQNHSITSPPRLKPAHIVCYLKALQSKHGLVIRLCTQQSSEEDERSDASSSQRSVVGTSEEIQFSESFLHSFRHSDCVCLIDVHTDRRDLWPSTSIREELIHTQHHQLHTKTLKCKFRNTHLVSLLSVSETSGRKQDPCSNIRHPSLHPPQVRSWSDDPLLLDCAGEVNTVQQRSSWFRFKHLFWSSRLQTTAGNVSRCP